MINPNKPIHVQQSRTVHRDYSGGEQPDLLPSKFARFSIFLDVTYDEKHTELINKLNEAVVEVMKVVDDGAKNHGMAPG